MTTHAGFYYTWDLDDDELDEQDEFRCLGLGDFHMFNLMLLSILPSLASMTTKMCITIGYLIAVQIGREASNKLSHLYNQSGYPGLPIPVIMVSLYTILLNAFIEC
jgi:hypothetical protein